MIILCLVLVITLITLTISMMIMMLKMNMNYQFYLKTNSNLSPITASVSVNGIPLVMDIDSSVAISAISKEVFDKHFSNLMLKKSNLHLRTYNGSYLKPVGVVRFEICYKNMTQSLEVHVIEDGGPPLLCRNWVHAFNIGVREINHIQNSDSILKTLFKSYADIFDGGLVCSNKNKVTLNLKEGAKPKFFRPRKLPFSLKDKVENELRKLVALNILEPVSYSEWGTPIVPLKRWLGTSLW